MRQLNTKKFMGIKEKKELRKKIIKY